MAIGDRIKYLRKSLNLTQQQFANTLDVDQGHIAGIERGSKNPSRLLQKVICLVFYVNDIWLKEGKGEIFISLEKVLKSLMARFGEQAIIEVFREKIIKETEHKTAPTDTIGVTSHTRPASDKDPELKRMIDTIHTIFFADDQRLKTWAAVQFDRAFPADVVEEAQKKQKQTYGQASAG